MCKWKLLVSLFDTSLNTVTTTDAEHRDMHYVDFVLHLHIFRSHGGRGDIPQVTFLGLLSPFPSSAMTKYLCFVLHNMDIFLAGITASFYIAGSL